VISVGFTPVAISLDLAQEVSNLQTTISGLSGLGGGLMTSLQAKLNAALAAIAAGNLPLACSDLQDFINQVNAQSGKKISTTDATNLINQAQSLQVQFGC
jgi:hypothetical protein